MVSAATAATYAKLQGFRPFAKILLNTRAVTAGGLQLRCQEDRSGQRDATGPQAMARDFRANLFPLLEQPLAQRANA